MSDFTPLRALAIRAEDGTGRDAGLEADIAVALAVDGDVRRIPFSAGWEIERDEGAVVVRDQQGRKVRKFTPAAFTTSLDAVASLAGELAPGTPFDVRRLPLGGILSRMRAGRDFEVDIVTGTHEEEPRARLAALLRLLAYRAKKEAGDD